MPSAAQLREAFLWSETRTVTKTAMVSLHGNRYEVDAVLVGRRVQVVFDPLDLTHLEVRHDSRDFGIAVPHELKVHVHPKATAEPPELLDGMTATGIDYLALIEQEHRQATGRSINFADLNDNDNDGGDVTEVGR